MDKRKRVINFKKLNKKEDRSHPNHLSSYLIRNKIQA